MKMWSFLGKLCSLTPGMKRVSLKTYYFIKKNRYRFGYAKRQITDGNVIVFESFMGKKYACSPKALYEEMMREPEYASMEKIWAFRNPGEYLFLEKNPNTKVVKYRSKDYYRFFAKAKYWVTNSRLPRELEPKQDQKYIQCWHGTPLKRLGLDLECYAERKGNIEEVRENYLEEAKRITHMPSPSLFYSEKMISAFGLKKYGKESVLLEWGYPRNDCLITADKKQCMELREKFDIPQGKKVLLYAPTWRENQHIPGEGYQYQLQVHFEKWKEQLEKEYLVLFRAHYFISNGFDFAKYEGFVRDVSQVDDVNELYMVSDVLITDYSSVFFDYANLNRPILFYMYDYEQYKNEMRDFYFDLAMLPGPVVEEEDELLRVIHSLDEVKEKYAMSYRKFNETFNPHREVCSRKYLHKWVK